jgi:hypothetical protein
MQELIGTSKMQKDNLMVLCPWMVVSLMLETVGVESVHVPYPD